MWFLFNRTTLQVFVTYLTGALYVHPLWFYRVIRMIVGVLRTCHTQYTWDRSICGFYLIEQHSKFLLHTLQMLYMCTLCGSTGLFEMIVGVLITCHTQHTWDRSICFFLFNRTALQVFVTYLTGLYICTLCDSTGLFEMIVGVLITCHTQYTWDRSIFFYLFNSTTLQVFVTYLIGAIYVHPLWFYKHQHDNEM